MLPSRDMCSDSAPRQQDGTDWIRVREVLQSFQLSLVDKPSSPSGWLNIQRWVSMGGTPAERPGADVIHAGGDADRRDHVEARGEETNAFSA
jgi:hypothetical protein